MSFIETNKSNKYFRQIQPKAIDVILPRTNSFRSSEGYPSNLISNTSTNSEIKSFHLEDVSGANKPKKIIDKLSLKWIKYLNDFLSSSYVYSITEKDLECWNSTILDFLGRNNKKKMNYVILEFLKENKTQKNLVAIKKFLFYVNTQKVRPDTLLQKKLLSMLRSL